MKQILTIAILLSSLFCGKASAQELGMYAFSRTAELVNYNFSNNKTTYIDGVSAGLGWFKKSLFGELGTILLEGDVHAHYVVLGKVLKSTDLGNSFSVNTSVFGQVDMIPIAKADDSWVYTGGLAVCPNVQIKKINVGVILTTGLAYQEEDFIWNSRMVVNMTYRLF